MEFEFKTMVTKSGARAYLRIPFNVWDACGQKGMIPVKADVEGFTFECKLVPKGSGMYCIPVKKEITDKLDLSDELSVKFEVINRLSRINSNSPYSKENPIRVIGNISSLKQPKNGLCGQTCVAMLAGVTVEDAIRTMKSKSGQASLSKVLETLDYYGLSYGKPVYTKGREVELPKCCIVNVRGVCVSHLMVYFDGNYYDTNGEVLQGYKYENIINYIEVATI
jgi:hypothetical protein